MDPKKVIDRASAYKNIDRSCEWIAKVASTANAEQHPMIALLSDDNPWTADYLSALDSDLSELANVKNSSQVAASMKNKDEFFDEVATLHEAAVYKRKGFDVEFIPRSSSKTPDFLAIKKELSKFSCVFEVKHISGEESVDPIRKSLRTIVSPYYVDVHVGKIELQLQAEHLAAEICLIIEKLLKEGAKPTREKPYQKAIDDSSVRIVVKPSGKSGPTLVGTHWGNKRNFLQTFPRLAQILDSARDQVAAYLPTAINIIVLDSEKGGLLYDEIEDTLYSPYLPGLFLSSDYNPVTAVKFVWHNLVPTERLFCNKANMHGNLSLLKSIGI
jgi:hypothetical protein